jgi:hypothetical protein
MTRDIHATPWEAGPIAHRADRRCPCGPRSMHDMLEPSVQVWVHRPPPPMTRVLVDGPLTGRGRAVTDDDGDAATGCRDRLSSRAAERAYDGGVGVDGSDPSRPGPLPIAMTSVRLPLSPIAEEAP